MEQQPDIVKVNTLWKNSRAGFSSGALLLGLGGSSKLSAGDLRLYASHPNPAADYAEAVRRVESKIASEVDFYPDSHTMLLTHSAKTAKVIIFVHGYPSSPSPFKEIAAQFYDRGYNVLVMTMPYHGLADWMNTKHAKLRVEDFMLR